MEQMRTAVRQCYGWSLPYGLSFDGGEAFDANDQLASESVAARVRMMARDLSIYGALLRDQFTRDLQGDTADTFAARYRQ